MKTKLKITCISDTHGSHRRVKLPGGDILIFAGDWQKHDSYFPDEFVRWLSEQKYKDIVVVRGNHDAKYLELDQECSKYSNIHLLHDSGKEIQGLFVYGTPWTNQFQNWSYMAEEHILAQIYSEILEHTNILVTHNPPFGIMDKFGDLSVGSASLLRETQVLAEICDLKLHVFGHIHSGYGIKQHKNHVSVNAAQMDEQYFLTNKPIEVEIDRG